MTNRDLFIQAHKLAAAFKANGSYTNYHAAFRFALTLVWANATAKGLIVRHVNKRRARSTSRRVVSQTRISNSRQDTYSRAIRFAKGKLGLKGGVNIKFVTASSLPKRVLGTCGGDTQNQQVMVRNTRNMDENLDTLFHEMIHAQQLQQGRLVQKQGGVRVWHNEVMHNNNLKWSQRPWEIEAIEGAKKLLSEFIQ